MGKGEYFIYTGSEQIQFKPLVFDGSYDSYELKPFIEESDIVVTNPPFSKFINFIDYVIDKKFLLICSLNALTYKNVFKHIQNQKLWLGVNYGRGISGFIVPSTYKAYGTEVSVDKNGNTIIATNNCTWVTNLWTEKKDEFIKLTKTYNPKDYPNYDNYDGINVKSTQDIPKDYNGVMGVPITFLTKYNPKQFEIVGFRKGNDGKDLTVNGKAPYCRVLIKRRSDSV